MADQVLWQQGSFLMGRRLVREAQAKVRKAKNNFGNRSDGQDDWSPAQLWQLTSELYGAHYDLMCAIYSYLNGPAGRFMLILPFVSEKEFLHDMRMLALGMTEKIPEYGLSYDIEDLQLYRKILAQVTYILEDDKISQDLLEQQIQLLYSRLEMLLAYLDFAPRTAKANANSGYQESRDKVYSTAMAMATLIKREQDERENQYRFCYSPPDLSDLMLLARLWHSRDRSETEVSFFLPWCRDIVMAGINCLSSETIKDHIRLAMMVKTKSKVAQGLRTLLGMRPRPWAAIAKAVMWRMRHG